MKKTIILLQLENSIIQQSAKKFKASLFRCINFFKPALIFYLISVMYHQSYGQTGCNTTCSDPMDWEITNTLDVTAKVINADSFAVAVRHSLPFKFKDNCYPYTEPLYDLGSTRNPRYRIQILRLDGSGDIPDYSVYTGFSCILSDMNFTGSVTGGELIVNTTFRDKSTDYSTFVAPDLCAGKYVYCIRVGTDKAHSEYVFGNFTIEGDFYITHKQLDQTSIQAGDQITASCRQNYKGESTNTIYVEMHYILSKNLIFGDNDDVYLSYDISSLRANDLYDGESAKITIPENIEAGGYHILFVADAPNEHKETDEDNNVASVAINIVGIPPTPTNVQASDGAFCDRVKITWDASDGALGYEVYVNNRSLGVTQENYFEVFDPPTGTNTYRVRAANLAGSSGYGFDDGYKQVDLSNVELTNIQASDGEENGVVRISWDKLPYDDITYYVMRNDRFFTDATSTENFVDDYTNTFSTPIKYEVYAQNNCSKTPKKSDTGYPCPNYKLWVSNVDYFPTFFIGHKKKAIIEIKNDGIATFSDSLFLSWHKANGEYITDLDRKKVSLAPGQTITLQTDNTPTSSSVGDYALHIKYKDSNAYGNCSGYKTLLTRTIKVRKRIYREAKPTVHAGDPINMLTGSFLWGHNDFILKTIVGQIPFQRFYDSRADYTSGFGNKWTHNFNMNLLIETDLVTLRDIQGKESYFFPNKENGFESSHESNTDTLYRQSGLYTLQKKNGTKYNFHPDGYLLNIKFSSGNSIFLNYGNTNQGGKRLEFISFPQRRDLTLIYDSKDRIIQVQDNAGRKTSYAYNNKDDLTDATNVRGGKVYYTYDTQGHLLTVTDARGNVTVKNTYDYQGRVISQKDAYDNTYTIDYDTPVENATTFTNPLGHSTVYYHDEYYRLSQIESPLKNTQWIEYDNFSHRPARLFRTDERHTTLSYEGAKANLSTITDALGATQNVTYDSHNYPIAITNPLGHTTHIQRNSKHQPTLVSFPNGSTMQMGYFRNGLPDFIVDQNGNRYYFTYNTFGDVTNIRTPTGSYVLNYDAAGKLTSIQDRNWKVTQIETDAYGNVTKSTDPMGFTIERSYNENGFLVSEKDKNGAITQYKYDKQNNLTSVIDANGNTTSLVRDVLGRVTQIIDAEHNQISTTYDAEGKVTSITNALGTYTFAYDSHGNRTSVTDALGNTSSVEYDVLNRPIVFRDALGNTSSVEYDLLGNIMATIDGEGHQTSYTYDVMGWLKTVTDPEQGSVNYTMDYLGNITKVADANGNTTSTTYNTNNLPISVTYPGGYSISNVFDKEGLLSSYTDEEGITATISRDNNYNIQSIDYSNGSTYHYTYDNNGWLSTARKDSSTITFTRDALGNVLSTQSGLGTIAYSYDKVYNRTQVIYPGNQAVTTTYNEAYLPIKTTDWLGNYTERSYNANGILTGIQNSNGSRTLLTLDALQRVDTYANLDGQHNIINKHKLIYNANSEIIEDNQATLPLQPRLDSLGQFVAYTYASDDRVLQAGNTMYVNNDRGAITSASGENSEHFAWGEDDLLLSYTLNDTETSYAYDVFGNRTQKVEDGETTNYLLDVNNSLSQVLQEQDAQGNIKATNIYTPNALGWRLDENNRAQFYAYNPMGHTIGLTNQAGILTDTYAYAPFGDYFNHQGNSPQPYTYLGKYGIQQENDDLYYVRARYLRPSEARFFRQR